MNEEIDIRRELHAIRNAANAASIMFENLNFDFKKYKAEQAVKIRELESKIADLSKKLESSK